MSIQNGNAQFAEATIAELELNKETLQDLEVDGRQVKGGNGNYALVGGPIVAGPVWTPPGTIRMTIGTSGTSVILPSGG
ncbi:MAG TPA: hypothetical protein VGM82_23600 [Gemmatimonadaceae bacterium]|jgi:hypothetical protein